MKERKALLLLAGASFLWGFAFVFQDQAAEIIDSGLFNGIRMFIGFLVILPLTIGPLKKHWHDKDYMRKLIAGGMILGVLLAIASYIQQIGIGMTTAGKAGFITSLYSLLVPVFAALTGKKTSLRTWACVLMGLCGAFMITMNGAFQLDEGDLLLFVCAVLFAIQIIVIDVLGKDLEGVDLSASQFLFSSIFSFILAIFGKENASFAVIKQAAIPILYVGIFSCGVAYTLQIVGQKYVHPAKGTLVLSLESVWAGIGGALILHERMTTRELLGCLLLFSAVVVAQLPVKRKKD